MLRGLCWLPKLSRALRGHGAILVLVATALADDSGYIYWCNDKARQLCPADGRILTDLSCGWCRSWTFAANIAGNSLRLVGLDGGALPGDGNPQHTYMMSASLDRAFDMSDATAWKLSHVPSIVWNLNNGALWSDGDNATLFRYGGHSLGGNPPDSNEVSTYDVASDNWSTTNGAHQAPRYTMGAPVDVPELGLAFYIGGLQHNGTTTDASVADGNYHYQTKVVQFDTSARQGVELEAPFLPVQHGAAAYLPVGTDATGSTNKGVLIYFGGESPSQTVVPKDNNMTTANAWDFVWIYDIGGDKWYKQPTTGQTDARTEFCSTTMYDDTTRSWQLWVMGGADFETKSIVSSVSILSIPSFRWFQAAEVPAATPPRMSLACQQYGPQIFGVGGRTQADDWGGEDFDTVAYLYDANRQTTVTTFEPSSSVYTAPQAVRSVLSTASLADTWGDDAVSALFAQQTPLPSSSGSDNPLSAGSSITSSFLPADKATALPTGSRGVNHSVNLGIPSSVSTMTTSTATMPIKSATSEGSSSPSNTHGAASSASNMGGNTLNGGTIAATVVSAVSGVALIICLVLIVLRKRAARAGSIDKATETRGIALAGGQYHAQHLDGMERSELGAGIDRPELFTGYERPELQGSKYF